MHLSLSFADGLLYRHHLEILSFALVWYQGCSTMHHGKRKVFGRGTVGKSIVMGLLERGDKDKGKVSQVVAKVVTDIKQETLQAEVKALVEPLGSVHRCPTLV